MLLNVSTEIVQKKMLKQTFIMELFSTARTICLLVTNFKVSMVGGGGGGGGTFEFWPCVVLWFDTDVSGAVSTFKINELTPS